MGRGININIYVRAVAICFSIIIESSMLTTVFLCKCLTDVNELNNRTLRDKVETALLIQAFSSFESRPNH